MKKKFLKLIATIFLCIILIISNVPIVYGRAHSSGARSSHSSVKSSTPKSSSSSKSRTVKSSTPKSSTTKSKTSGKTYTTTKSSTGRTTVEHSTVKPKTNSEGKSTIVNNNPTYYTNYSTDTSYPITNSIFQFYILSEIFSDKENVSEQDIVKALEERGYTQEEVNQILDEAKAEEEANKPFYDGWQWYNWLIFIVCIIAIIAIIIGIMYCICSI